MSNYESTSKALALRKEIDMMQERLAQLVNRRAELKDRKASNEPLRRKLLDKNRIEINRATDMLALKKMELADAEGR